MKPHMFIFSPCTAEDFFSMSLAYIINLFPDIGQKLVRKVAVLAGKAPGYFGEFQQCEFVGWEFLEVRRTFCRVSKKLLTPKSGKIRRVDMSRQLSDTLKVLLTERKKETLQKGWAEVPLWVNISTTGTMLDGDHVRKRAFYPILKQAELRHVRLHDLRHTFASLLIQNGESLAYVRDQMGHHSIQVTVDTYGHLVPGGNRQAVDRLDDPEEDEPEATSRNLSTTAHKNTVLRKKRSA